MKSFQLADKNERLWTSRSGVVGNLARGLVVVIGIIVILSVVVFLSK